MSKSIMNLLKKNKKDDLKELQNRADQFIAEYKTIRMRYRCDFQSYMEMVDGGQGGIKPRLRIVDATQQVEAEELEEKQPKTE